MNKRVSKAFGILFLLLELAVIPKAVSLLISQPLSELSLGRIIALAMTFSSIILCLLMSFSSLSENAAYPRHTFLFELAVFMCCMAPMTELFTEALDNIGRSGLNMLVNTVFYLIGINIAYVLMRYEFLIIGKQDTPVMKKIRFFADMLMIIDNLATLLNIRFGYFFSINESGMYQSAPTYWLAFLGPAIIVAIIAVAAAKEMKPGRQRRAFQLFWIFTIVASLIQIRNSELSVQYTGYTLSLIVIYMNIQSELDTFCTDAERQEK